MLYTNGCSHTAGTKIALDNNFDLAWPHVLGKKLNCEVVNDAKRGSSNDSIIRRTMEFISQCAIPPKFVAIQISNPQRLNLGNHEHIITREGIVEGDIVRYKRNADIRWADPDGEYYEKKMLRQIYILQLFLEEHGVDNYVIYRWWSLQLKHLLKDYAISRHINFNNHLFSTNIPGLVGQLYHNGFRLDESDGHFKADGHEQTAEWIYNHFKGVRNNNILKDIDDRKDYEDLIYRYED
jgi:hypothetical protein